MLNLVDEDNIVALRNGELGGIRGEGHARHGVVLRPFSIGLRSERKSVGAEGHD